jgi:hypothetical protein
MDAKIKAINKEIATEVDCSKWRRLWIMGTRGDTVRIRFELFDEKPPKVVESQRCKQG